MSAAPFNLKLYGLPLPVLVWLGQQQYQAPYSELPLTKIFATGWLEIVDQYHEVSRKAGRLGVAIAGF